MKHRTIAVYNMCLRCRFWEWNADYLPKPGQNPVREPPDANREYKCRAHPPIPVNLSDSVWPVTKYTDYCGKDFEFDHRLYGKDD